MVLKTANNAKGVILGTLGASTETVTIKSNKGGLFPSVYPYNCTIEQLVGGSVVKREIVTVTGRTNDTFTITRGTEACPASSLATTQTTTNFEFKDGDLFELRNTGAKNDEIDAELTRLESVKGNDTALVHKTGNETISGIKSGSFEIDTTGDISANFFSGDGSNLTGISSEINTITEKSNPTTDDEVLIYSISDLGNRKTNLFNIINFNIFGSGINGDVSGALTISGNDNSVIIKEYDNFTPGVNIITTSSQNSLIILKIKGDANLTGTTFDFNGKGGLGDLVGLNQNGTGYNYNTGKGGSSGYNGADGGEGGGGGASLFNPGIVGESNTDGIGGAGGIKDGAIKSLINYKNICCGASGGTGGTGNNNTSGGTRGKGGNGGGGLIVLVGGNLLLDGTIFNFDGNAGGDADIDYGWGGGGGGAGGSFGIYYNGTLTDVSSTINTSGGVGGLGDPAGGGADDGGNGGAGGDGSYFIGNIIL